MPLASWPTTPGGDEGLTREQRAWVADPDLIRRLHIGQACYIHRGAATFVRVARPTPSPLSLPAARARTAAPACPSSLLPALVHGGRREVTEQNTCTHTTSGHPAECAVE